MIGVALFVVVLGGTDALDKPGDRFFLEVARGAREVFLDPSESHRKVVTERVVGRTLVPLLNLDEARNCDNALEFDNVVVDLAAYGDEDIFLPAIGELEATYHRYGQSLGNTSCDPHASSQFDALVASFYEIHRRPIQRRSKQRLRLELADARASCRHEKNEPLPEDCGSEMLELMGLAGDVGAPARGEDSAVDRWREMFASYPLREDRLIAALRLPLVDGSKDLEANSIVRRWALDELLGAADPREWNPSDVAIVIAEASREAAAFAASHNEVRGAASTSRDHPGWRLRELLLALRPMGLQRASDLVSPRQEILAYIPSREEVRTPDGVIEHFPHEGFLYIDEWSKSKRGLECEDPKSKVQPACGNDYLRYQTRSWFLTDDAAPHPDMKAVRKAIKKLEARRKNAAP